MISSSNLYDEATNEYGDDDDYRYDGPDEYGDYGKYDDEELAAEAEYFQGLGFNEEEVNGDGEAERGDDHKDANGEEKRQRSFWHSDNDSSSDGSRADFGKSAKPARTRSH
jgi:hypothetical protein